MYAVRNEFAVIDLHGLAFVERCATQQFMATAWHRKSQGGCGLQGVPRAVDVFGL